MAGYTKEFLIDAAMYRFLDTPADRFERHFLMTEAQYDRDGKDAFRVSCGLDAAAIKKYKAWLEDNKNKS
jgi:hypothetical protein